MPSDTVGEKKVTKSQFFGGPPTESEHLPCPRCDSCNTKFCYYNNYNLSQPRHFCKACRRYWTQGGSLRNIPVGGGTRKNISLKPFHKRSRISDDEPISANPVSFSSYTLNNNNTKTEPDSGMSMGSGTTGNGPIGYRSDVSGTFTSLLNTISPPGFLALGGFGLGIGSGFEEMGLGFEVGRVGWPLTHHQVNDAVDEEDGGGNTWQLGSGGDGGGFGEGDCFAWPELAISTPRKSMK
ncbi:hypothetical protein GIB67_019526 [Kingdonia uniflora]|uniref:Dof zinc finger protein n=1 Tax=Kingdonia uniflora TaxID=39325 RepID=A0A7J7N0C5_9MAGN|nr:hypothetical protein GIB67_019526 [Kingdonia uniflora]